MSKITITGPNREAAAWRDGVGDVWLRLDNSDEGRMVCLMDAEGHGLIAFLSADGQSFDDLHQMYGLRPLHEGDVIELAL